jgi:hypothetical protein
VCGGTELLVSWWPGSRLLGKGSKQDIAPKDMPPVHYFLQLDPTSLSFQNPKGL